MLRSIERLMRLAADTAVVGIAVAIYSDYSVQAKLALAIIKIEKKVASAIAKAEKKRARLWKAYEVSKWKKEELKREAEQRKRVAELKARGYQCYPGAWDKDD